MEMDQDSLRDPLSIQESRNERRARLVRRRRRTAFGTLVALVVLAAGGYGGYELATRGERCRDHDHFRTSIRPIYTGVAGGDGSGSTTTIGTMPNLAPQPLEISTDPEVVNLTITLQDGTSLTGKTPFSEDVPGGTIRVALSQEGLQRTRCRSLTLDKPAA